jgi:hypothetical protein
LTINNTGLSSGEGDNAKQFVSLGKQIALSADEIKVSANNNATLSLTKNEENLALFHEHSSQQSCGFYFAAGETSYKMNSENGAKTKMVWKDNDI